MSTSLLVDPSHLNDDASANSTPMSEETGEITSRLEVETGIHRQFVESERRMELYSRWKELNVSSQNAKTMSGLDWMSFMFYNAPVGEVVDELFEFFEAYLLQPMHGRWLKAGSLWRRLPPNVLRDATNAGVSDYAKLPSRMYLIGAYVDAFHPEESVARIALNEEELAQIRGSAEEVVSVFETLVEHMGAGRVPSSDMVGHFPSLLMSYAVTSVQMRIRQSGSGASVAKDRASADAARDWYLASLEAAAAEAMRRATGMAGVSRDVARRLGEEWRSVATILKSYRAMLAGVAGGSRVVPAKSVSILPYVPLPAYALNPQRLVYEAVVMRGMGGHSERKRGRELGEGEVGGGSYDGGEEEGGGPVLLPNPIMDEWDRRARRGMRDEEEEGEADMSIDEARSRLGPNSLVASRRAFLLFRDAYWARFEAVGAGDAARRGDDDGEDGEEEEEEEPPEDARARMSDGATAARVLKDLVCALKEVLLTQGGNYSYSRLNEDKGLERLQEVVHVGLTGRTLPGCTWDSAVAVVRCMFRYLMFKCSLLSPAQVLELHRGRELRMCVLEQHGDDEMEDEGDGDDDHNSVARGRRKAMLDALRFLVETVQRIRWDSDNERVVRLSPLLERCAVYVLRKGVARGIAREAQRRRKAHDGRIKCHICEPAGGGDGLGRLRAFVANVCRDDADHIASTPETVRVRVCVLRGVVRKLLGCFVPGVGPFSWDRYDAEANVLKTIPEGYDECSACVTRRMDGDFWLPEPLAVFDDARLRRLRRRFEFVVRMEAVLSASVRIFRQSFHRYEPQFDQRFNEAVRVLLGHMRRVVAAERERRWGAWSEVEMRAVLHAAVQFRSGVGSSMQMEAREMDEIIVNTIMERSSPYQILHETMQLRRAINAEKLIMAESRFWDAGEARLDIAEKRHGNSETAKRPKRARTESEGASTSATPPTPPPPAPLPAPPTLSQSIGLGRSTFSATELNLRHDECEILSQTWSEVLHEIAVVCDLTMEVSGEYYKAALDGVYGRNPGLRSWRRPDGAVAGSA